MLEERCNIWDKHAKGHWICITTNGFVKANGEAVMGAGVAKQAACRFPSLPKRLGYLILLAGNRPVVFQPERLFTFPVKHNWWEQADLALIAESARALKHHPVTKLHSPIYIPRPGCGNGQLRWEQVKPIMDYLDDRFVVVTL